MFVLSSTAQFPQGSHRRFRHWGNKWDEQAHCRLEIPSESEKSCSFLSEKLMWQVRMKLSSVYHLLLSPSFSITGQLESTNKTRTLFLCWINQCIYKVEGKQWCFFFFPLQKSIFQRKKWILWYSQYSKETFKMYEWPHFSNT